MTEREAYIALNMMEQVGPVGAASLRGSLGSMAVVFTAGESELMRCPKIGPETARQIVRQRETLDPAGEIERAAKIGAAVVTPVDESYPRRLLEIHDPPLALYVKGEQDPGERHYLAVVGTRHPTQYGRSCAETLAYGLTQAGFVVVSGLARGIDTAAHRGALKAGGRTVAVIGSGIDSIYPPENEGLAREIAGKGAVISEFRLGRKPDKTTFPIRNRIVSGFSEGVLVVEAGGSSGALITARIAAEQGRTVFAVPGRIDSPLSRGTHDLLRNGARLVEGVDDIIDEFQFLLPRGFGKQEAAPGPAPKLSEDERRLVNLLSEGGMDVDTLIRESGFEPGAVSSMLITLEMKKVARILPGRMVELARGR